jgi:hypothetical protein
VVVLVVCVCCDKHLVVSVLLAVPDTRVQRLAAAIQALKAYVDFKVTVGTGARCFICCTTPAEHILTCVLGSLF